MIFVIHLKNVIEKNDKLSLKCKYCVKDSFFFQNLRKT